MGNCIASRSSTPSPNHKPILPTKRDLKLKTPEPRQFS